MNKLHLVRTDKRIIAAYLDEEMAQLHLTLLKKDYANWRGRVNKDIKRHGISHVYPLSYDIPSKMVRYQSPYDQKQWTRLTFNDYPRFYHEEITVHVHLDQFLGHYGD